MGDTYALTRSDTVEVSHELFDIADGSPITTATVTVSCYEQATGFYLDWSDLAFKASGWTTQWDACAHAGAGVYSRADLDFSAVSNLSPTGRRCELVFYIVNTTPALDYYSEPDILLFDSAVTGISVPEAELGSTGYLFRVMKASLAASDLATVGVYTPQGESAITMRAIQNRTQVIEDTGAGPQARWLDPTLTIREDDLPNGVYATTGDSWVAGGVTYAVKYPQYDGRGGILCQLKRNS